MAAEILSVGRRVSAASTLTRVSGGGDARPGARHVGYGARPEHYPVVAEVLIESMAALGLIAGAMLEGAAVPA